MFKNWNTGTAGENQDGGTGRHTAPPHKTKRRQQFKINKQPELTENRTARKSDNQGDKEETIQTGRRGGDGQLDPETGGLWDERGQAVQPLADPAAPHPRIDELGGTAGEQSRPGNPGLQL